MHSAKITGPNATDIIGNLMGEPMIATDGNTLGQSWTANIGLTKMHCAHHVTLINVFGHSG